MKTFLMMILFAGGFAIQHLDAQKCCIPCPPGCCITSCSKAVNGSAAYVKNAQPIEATFASFLITAQETLGQTPSTTVSKACLPSCQAAKVSTTSCQPANTSATACKTNLVSHAACGATTTVAVSTPSTRTKEKS